MNTHSTRINYVKGNVLRAPQKVIAHGCNAQGKMGAGVALAIRKKFPEAYQTYMSAYKEQSLVVGNVIFAISNYKTIANCIIQEFYGRDGALYLDYAALRKCMSVLNDLHCGIAMPRIGCNLAGGDWELVATIIEEEFTKSKAFVYIG